MTCRIPLLRKRNDVLPDAGSALSGFRPMVIADNGILNQKEFSELLPLATKKRPAGRFFLTGTPAFLFEAPGRVILRIGCAVAISVRIHSVGLAVSVDIRIIFIRDTVSVDVLI